MNYREEYTSKLTTAAQAVTVVKNGDWIDYGWCTGHPVALDQALAERMPQLTDIKVRGGVALWAPAIFKIDNPQEHFCWNSWHMSGVERKAADRASLSTAPCVILNFPASTARM